MKKGYEVDYPLQGSTLDLPLKDVLEYDSDKREKYIVRLILAFSRNISDNEMALKKRVPFGKEMRDLRRLVRYPADKFLFLDELTFKRNVLGRNSPGGTHAYWSRKTMWQMATKHGNLLESIQNADSKLLRKLDKLLDGKNSSKKIFRNFSKTAIQNVLSYIEVDTGVGTAFPPFHARFFAEEFLPKTGSSIVVDPCAGWGGRLLGTLCVDRKDPVMYIGIDPEKRNQEAYENIYGRIRKYLRSEIPGERYMNIFYDPFEDWIKTNYATRLKSMVDLVITSPPYFSAELYNIENSKQSAIRYDTYDDWRDSFYRVLIQGAFDLLKPGGTFVLNVANVSSSNNLEKDARLIAKDVGFQNGGFYKMAMSIVPGTRKGIRHRVIVDGIEFKHEPVFIFKKH